MEYVCYTTAGELEKYDGPVMCAEGDWAINRGSQTAGTWEPIIANAQLAVSITSGSGTYCYKSLSNCTRFLKLNKNVLKQPHGIILQFAAM